MTIRKKMLLFVACVSVFSTGLMILGAVWMNYVYYKKDVAHRLKLAAELVEVNAGRIADDLSGEFEALNNDKEMTRLALVGLSASHPRRSSFFKYFFALDAIARKQDISQLSVYFISARNPDPQLYCVIQDRRVFSFSTSAGNSGHDALELELDNYGFISPVGELIKRPVFQLPVSLPAPWEGLRAQSRLYVDGNGLYLDSACPLHNPSIGGSNEDLPGFAYKGLRYGVVRSLKKLSRAWLDNLERQVGVRLDIFLEDGRHGLGGLPDGAPMRTLTGKELFTRESGNTAYLSLSIPLILDEYRAGYIVTSLPRTALATQIRNTALLLVGIGAVTMLLAMILGSVMAMFFVRPILNLSKGANRIAKGDLTHPIETKGQDEMGSLARSFANMRDAVRQKIEELNNEIHARTEAENEVRKAEEKYRRIFENSVEGIFQTTPDGRLVTANPTMAQLLGYDSPEELMDKIGANVNALYADPDKRESVLKLIRNEGQLTGYEVNFRRKDGTLVLISMNARVVLDENNDVRFFEGTLLDISDREEKEQAERERMAAEAATIAKSDFLARMSHEIRTPMNGIIGMAHLALQTELNNEQKNYVEKIDISAKALLGIINDILDFSKIEAGKLTIDKHSFDLFRAVDRIINLIEHRAHQKRLELVVQYDPRIVRNYIGDSLRISQIIVNLMGNAIKFTDEGEIGLYISDAGKGHVRFEVKDTGIGLSEGQQALLFQSFSQADGSTTRKYGGTGLGLSISKQLVGLMNGTIWVESKLGKGSSFIFEIELSRDPEKKEKFKTFEGKRVLIVDDTPTWHEALKSMLKLFGLQVDSAHSGFEALEMTQNGINQYDLILMDWQMPKMDGIRTTLKIKEAGKKKHPPTVIMISSYRQDTIVRDAEQAGINIFLQKPVNPSSLYDVLSCVFLDEIHATNIEQLQHESLAGEIRKLTGSHILLVEDTITNQEIVQGLLKHSGIRIDVANNGKEAVAAHDKNPGKYELILMDIHMPVMDGYEASRLVREKDKEIPIIALTANAMKEDIVRTQKAGMNSYLSKPIDVEKFYETLLQYIRVKDHDAGQAPVADSRNDGGDLSLPEFDLIDVDKGLKHLSGNKKLYQKIIRDFKNDYSGLNLDSMEDDVFKRTTHTIKGLAANIGATAMHGIARQLDETQDKALIPQFNNILARLVAEIEEKMPDEDLLVSRAEKIPAEKAKEMFIRLKEAVESMQPYRYEPLLEELARYQLPDETNAILSRVTQALDEYDFDQAIEIIAEI